MTRAYSNRVGLMADAPQFPAAWDEVMEKVKIADELGFDSIWLGESWGYELFTSMADLVRDLGSHDDVDPPPHANTTSASESSVLRMCVRTTTWRRDPFTVSSCRCGPWVSRSRRSRMDVP